MHDIECFHLVFSSFTIGNNETAMFHFGVILNPVSDTAQKYSSLLEVGLRRVRIPHSKVLTKLL